MLALYQVISGLFIHGGFKKNFENRKESYRAWNMWCVIPHLMHTLILVNFPLTRSAVHRYFMMSIYKKAHETIQGL
jgi:hypothetical protein